MNYKLVRRITFCLYIFSALAFCLFLVLWGGSEIERLQHYSDIDKKYVTSVLNCQNTMSKVEVAFSRFLIKGTKHNSRILFDNLQELDESVTNTVDLEEVKMVNSGHDNDVLCQNVSLAMTAALAIQDSYTSQDLDRYQLLDDAKSVLLPALIAIRVGIEKKVYIELSFSSKRQNEVTFFFEKMLKIFVVFFVLTVSFSVSSSFILDRVLQKGLKRLSTGAHEISGGNYEYRFDGIMNDEIGSVMMDFNEMARQLQTKTDELLQANVELINTSKHKDRFLANMSHELRTPLNSVVGFSELLIERADKLSVDRIQAYGKRILSASEHLLALISDLLDVVKVDAGVIKLDKQKFNLTDCVREVCDMLQPIVKNDRVSFKVEVESDMEIIADKRLIKQIIINLVNNASKFTHVGCVEVSATRVDDGYNISISDTGIGISIEEQSKIFDDFHRVESGMTANYEGVGIGLTLTKRLVELHGGTISLVSELNEGSIFTVFLPKKGIGENEK